MAYENSYTIDRYHGMQYENKKMWPLSFSCPVYSQDARRGELGRVHPMPCISH